MSVFDGQHIIAVNSRGEKQVIPKDWLFHPVLGKGFRLPPSAVVKPEPTPVAPVPVEAEDAPKATVRRRAASGKSRGATNTPLSGEEMKEAPDA